MRQLDVVIELIVVGGLALILNLNCAKGLDYHARAPVCRIKSTRYWNNSVTPEIGHLANELKITRYAKRNES